MCPTARAAIPALELQEPARLLWTLPSVWDVLIPQDKWDTAAGASSRPELCSQDCPCGHGEGPLLLQTWEIPAPCQGAGGEQFPPRDPWLLNHCTLISLELQIIIFKKASAQAGHVTASQGVG